MHPRNKQRRPNIWNSIGSNIKQLRKEKNLTQEQLAELVGVSFQAISKWENNIGYLDITLLPALSSVLDASVDTIMGVDRSQAEVDRLLLEIGETSKSGRLREAYEMGRESLCRFELPQIVRTAQKEPLW